MRHVLQDSPEVEYVQGKPYPKVSPKRVHAMVQAAAILILQRCSERRGAVGPEWRFRLEPATTLVPDVAFVSYERLRVLTDEEADEPPFAPDIAVEVRSPSRRASLMAKKIEQYLVHGARLVLDVDPAARIVHAYSSDSVRTYGKGERFECASFPWLHFDVAELFATLEIPR